MTADRGGFHWGVKGGLIATALALYLVVLPIEFARATDGLVDSGGVDCYATVANSFQGCTIAASATRFFWIDARGKEKFTIQLKVGNGTPGLTAAEVVLSQEFWSGEDDGDCTSGSRITHSGVAPAAAMRDGPTLIGVDVFSTWRFETYGQPCYAITVRNNDTSTRNLLAYVNMNEAPSSGGGGGVVDVNVTNTPTVALSQSGTANDVDVASEPATAKLVKLSQTGLDNDIDAVQAGTWLVGQSSTPWDVKLNQGGANNDVDVSNFPVKQTVAFSQTGTDNDVDSSGGGSGGSAIAFDTASAERVDYGVQGIWVIAGLIAMGIAVSLVRMLWPRRGSA